MSDSTTWLGDRYELLDIIGRGGMAEVWQARDHRLGRLVAVKRLRVDLASDSTFQARFQREAQSAAGLNHPNIVAVYDTGEEMATDGTNVAQPYIVMEYVDGDTLVTLVGADGRPHRPGQERAHLDRQVPPGGDAPTGHAQPHPPCAEHQGAGAGRLHALDHDLIGRPRRIGGDLAGDDDLKPRLGLDAQAAQSSLPTLSTLAPGKKQELNQKLRINVVFVGYERLFEAPRIENLLG